MSYTLYRIIDTDQHEVRLLHHRCFTEPRFLSILADAAPEGHVRGWHPDMEETLIREHNFIRPDDRFKEGVTIPRSVLDTDQFAFYITTRTTTHPHSRVDTGFPHTVPDTKDQEFGVPEYDTMTDAQKAFVDRTGYDFFGAGYVMALVGFSTVTTELIGKGWTPDQIVAHLRNAKESMTGAYYSGLVATAAAMDEGPQKTPVLRIVPTEN